MRSLATAAVVGTVALMLARPALSQVILNTTALAMLEQTNPDHFRKVDEIIRIASEQGCATAVEALKAKFDVANAYCDPPEVLRTSNPPKRRLTFTLGGTAYVLFLTASPAIPPSVERLQRK